MESFGAPSTGDTYVNLSWCGEGGFQVALGELVGYHYKTFKKVISICTYLKGVNESVYVVVTYFLSANVFMCLAKLGPVMALVDKMDEFLESEALDLAEALRIPLTTIGIRFTIVRVVIFVLRKDNGARGRT